MAKKKRDFMTYIPYLTVGLFLIIVAEVFINSYNNSPARKAVPPTQPTPTAAKQQPPSNEELLGFPAYPMGRFQKKEGTTYTWLTYDSLVQVYNWYLKNRAKSAWRCEPATADRVTDEVRSAALNCHFGTTVDTLTIKTDGNKTTLLLKTH